MSSGSPHSTCSTTSSPDRPLHVLVQPEPHADEPVMGGMGIDKGVEGLVAFAVALGLPGADGTPALEAGNDGLFA